MVRVNLSNIISVPAFLKLAIGNIDSLLKIATIAYFSLVKVKNKNDSKFWHILSSQMQLLSRDLIYHQFYPERYLNLSCELHSQVITSFIYRQTNKQTFKMILYRDNNVAFVLSFIFILLL